MRIAALVLGLAFLGGLAGGCTAYSVQAHDTKEGTVWISDGASIWHCTSSGKTAMCKRVHN